MRSKSYNFDKCSKTCKNANSSEEHAKVDRRYEVAPRFISGARGDCLRRISFRHNEKREGRRPNRASTGSLKAKEKEALKTAPMMPIGKTARTQPMKIEGSVHTHPRAAGKNAPLYSRDDPSK
jgi:hypothetical protein